MTLSGESRPKGHTLGGPVCTTLETTVTETETGEWPGKGLGKEAHGDGRPALPHPDRGQCPGCEGGADFHKGFPGRGAVRDTQGLSSLHRL